MNATGLQILVVDDETDHRELVSRTLGRCQPPFDVTAVADGTACLEALASREFAVVLLDHTLPDMNGFEVLDQLKARGISVPVIMVTAQGDEKIVSAALTAGALDYVMKTPGYLTTLPAVVRKVLMQHELARENARLYQAAQDRAIELAILAEVGRTLTSSLELSSVLDAIGGSALTLTRAHRCVVFELDPTDQRLYPCTSAGSHLVTSMVPLRLGQGAAGLAAQQREIVFSADVLRQPPPGYETVLDTGLTLRDHAAKAGIHAVLAVPMVSRDTVFGSICLYWNEPREYDERSVRLLTAFAQHAAVAVENARLHEETQRRLRDTQSLVVLAEALTSTLELTPLLKQVAQVTARACDMDRCAIYLWQSERVVPVMAQYADGREDPDLSSAFHGLGRMALDELPLFAETVRRRTAVVVTDPAADPLVPPSLRAFDMKAALAVPLIRQEKVVGAIVLEYTERARRISPAQIALATTIASQVALAVDNARLHEEIERRLHETAGLLAVAQVLSSSLDPQEIARRALREITDLMGADSAMFLALDEPGETLELLTGYHVPTSLRPSPRLRLVDRPPFIEEAHRTGDPVGTTDVSDFFCFDAVDGPPVRPRAILYVPVRSKDVLRGAIACVWWDASHEMTDEESRLAAGLANQMGLALDNARLYAATQQALTELRAAQETLVRGETLRALGELAGGAAHHLNNLLTVVVGRIQLLQQKPELRDFRRPLQIIEQAARDGAEVVRRVQQFSQMRHVDEYQLVDVNEITDDVVEMTRARWQDIAQAQGVTIEVACERGDVPPVAGDAAALREVLTNLIFNAVDALPDGGRIAVATCVDGPAVVLSVADTGGGMPEEVRRRAHEPFFTTKGVKSTGLGLSVSYGIVKRHGGDLLIESREGQGTRVVVQLPAATAAPPPEVTAHRERAAAPLRILVIDDEATVREALHEILDAFGHTVIEAASGTEGLARMGDGDEVDLVLTDLGMPGLTGWDVARTVKTRARDVTVGLITGWGEVPAATLAQRREVDFVVAKPFSIDALRATLAAVVPRHAVR